MAVIQAGEYKIETSSFFTDGYPFTDSKGRVVKLTSRTFWNPEFYRITRIRTLRGVVNWVIENRDAIREVRDEIWVDDFLYGSSSFFNFYDANQFFTFSTGDFTTSTLDRACPDYEVKDGRQPQGFFLLENNVEVEPVYTIHSIKRFGKVVLMPSRVDRPSSVDDIWSRTHTWSFKMEERTYDFFRQLRKEVDMFFGLELEISTKLSGEEIQQIVAEVEPKQKPFFIFKSDSSVTGCYQNRMEIVTVPCTPRYLRHNFKVFFRKIEELCEKKGKSVSDYFDTSPTLNNGLHIHISRECFVNKFDERKFLSLWNTKSRSTKHLFNTVACRPSGVGVGYCKTAEQYKRASQGFLLRSDVSIDRTSMCHGGNSKTLEVRAYQGIFDISHILRCISFTEACVEYVSQAGNKDVFEGFVPRMKSLVFSTRKYASLQGVFK